MRSAEDAPQNAAERRARTIVGLSLCTRRIVSRGAFPLRWQPSHEHVHRLAIRHLSDLLGRAELAGCGVAGAMGISDRGIGARRTYIQSFPGAAAGFPYFMMDLVPAPHLFDRDMLMINDQLEDEAFTYFRKHVSECDALITPDLNSAEAAIFRAAYPNAGTFKRSLNRVNVYVLIAPR